MKSLSSIFVCLLSLHAFSQTATTTSTFSATEQFLRMDTLHQKKTFVYQYGYASYSVYDLNANQSSSANNIQVVKPAIIDTIKPFFNTVTVNAQTMAAPTQAFLDNSYYSTFDNTNPAALTGKIKFDVAGFPYRHYLSMVVNLNAAIDPKGKNVLLNGRDTIDAGSVSHSSYQNKWTAYGYFTFDSSASNPYQLKISGTAEIRIPSEFLITSFNASDINIPKRLEDDTYTLISAGSGKIRLEAQGNTKTSAQISLPQGREIYAIK